MEHAHRHVETHLSYIPRESFIAREAFIARAALPRPEGLVARRLRRRMATRLLRQRRATTGLGRIDSQPSGRGDGP